mgnify:FL=1
MRTFRHVTTRPKGGVTNPGRILFAFRPSPTPLTGNGCACARIPGKGERKLEWRKKLEDTTWPLWTISGALLFLAVSWLVSIILPLSLLEAAAAVVVLALIAAVIVVVLTMVAIFAIGYLASRIMRGVNWGYADYSSTEHQEAADGAQ